MFDKQSYEGSMTLNNFRKDVFYLLLGIHDSTLSFNVGTRK